MEKEQPLSVAISALVKDNKILLIKREKGNFIGFWGLPGGKIEKNEHPCEASIREIFEESGIESEFKGHLAVVSEQIIEKDNVQNIILHVCELNPLTLEIKNNEQQLNWFDLNKIIDEKEKIIPSDFLIIHKIIKDKEKNYFISVIEKINDTYTQIKFE